MLVDSGKALMYNRVCGYLIRLRFVSIAVTIMLLMNIHLDSRNTATGSVRKKQHFKG